MRLTISTGLVIGTLGGCCHTHPQVPEPFQEDARVASQCTPVRELLSKNITKVSRSTTLVSQTGEELGLAGAILDSDEAARVAKLDFACRAWVYNVLSDDQYADAILTGLAVTILDAEPARRDDLRREVIAELRDSPAALVFGNASIGAALQAKTTTLGEAAPEVRDLALDIAVFRKADVAQIDYLEGQAALVKGIERLEGQVQQLSGQLEAIQVEMAGSSDQLQRVFFSTGSAELSHGERLKLASVANALHRTGQAVSIDGYADPRGGLEANLALSSRRAEAVRQTLEQNGVVVLRSVGRGEHGPPGGDQAAARVVTISYVSDSGVTSSGTASE